MCMADEHESAAGWSEDASADFIDTADLFVPARGEQVATLVALIPALPDEVSAVAELASGDGTLAEAILQAFPRCRYLALDGSALMREQTRARLVPYASRVEVRSFLLEDREWRMALLQPLRC